MKHISIFSLMLVALFSCNAQDQSRSSEQNTEVTQQNPGQVKNLAQSDLSGMIEKENVVLIDVRTPGEVSQGYISGADMFIDYNSPSFQSEIDKLDKSKTYVMYCRSGARSGGASQYMVGHGFGDVYNLTGGIMNYRGDIKKD